MTEWILAAGALITAIVAIYKTAVLPIIRAVKRIHLTYDQVMDYGGRLDSVERRSLELVRNSGSSLRDAVDRIERGQRHNAEALSDHITWGNTELVKIWQSLAAKDTVEAAARTAEVMAEVADERGNSNGMDA